MPSKQELNGEQARVSRRGAAWIAENLLDRIMFGIRSNGTIKDLIVRLKEDGQVFPLEWFKSFRVKLWLADNAAITCGVGKVKDIKRKFFYFSLVPSSDCDQAVWDALEEKDVIHIELVVGEEHMLFALCDEKLRLFLRQEMH